VKRFSDFVIYGFATVEILLATWILFYKRQMVSLNSLFAIGTLLFTSFLLIRSRKTKRNQ
jgi:hypothetical protein